MLFLGEIESIRLAKLRFNDQDIVDALRNTITVIVPIGLFFLLGLPSAALGVGTGTLLICLTDLPGTRSEKLFGATVSILTFFVVAVLISLSIQDMIALPIVTAVLTFLLMMFASLGQRMAAIGLMGLAIAAFTIGLHPAHAFTYAIFIVAGGGWYFVVSLAQAWLFPYHSLRRALAKTRKDTSALMRLRAMGYDSNASLSGFNARNIKLQLKLTSGHELVRRLLLGDKFSINFENPMARQLLKQATLLIDLYEQVTALHYDYVTIRRELQGSGILEPIKDAIGIAADMLEGKYVGTGELDRLISKIEGKTINFDQNRVLIDGIVLNLKQTAALAFALDDGMELDSKMQSGQLTGFLTEGSFSLNKVKIHLRYSSQIFRFALRMSILMLVVVFLIEMLPKGSYGYWLPITLIVICRPSYGMTMKRNVERILGTFIGLVLGWGLLEVNLPTPVLLGLTILSLFVFFAFLSMRYWVSAMGITLAVVLCLSVYHGHPDQVLSERLLFTVLGCFIGLAATFMFPVRHGLNLKAAIYDAVLANKHYLEGVLTGSEGSLMTVKLARKQSYLALSILNEAISLAAKEPRWKRKELRALKQVELLCFQLNALTAALPLADMNILLHTQVIKDLEDGIGQIAQLYHGQVFVLRPLERLDGPLDLPNVSRKLRSIFVGMS